VDLYKKKHQLLLQEKKLFEINRNLQFEINDRRASEEKIVELNKQLIKHVDHLEKANKDLDRFAFMASHDLQEPLRKILTFSGRVYSRAAGALDSESLMDLKRIQKATLRMKNLIQDILTFSTLTTQQDNFVKSDMRALVCEAVEDLHEIISEKKAVIEVSPLPLLSVYPGLMRPLFVNLISNALKYSKPDVPPQISIYQDEASQATGAVSGNRYCRIYIKDNGIGFDQRYSEQIFEMFKRLHSQSQYEGTGIGLALCKHIVEQHEGFINVMSKPGEGSTFILSFPLEVSNADGKSESCN
ncbi:MAG: hybrid sensor histidine kinase/response regulator, partial [Chitinophagaceae bacterium]